MYRASIELCRITKNLRIKFGLVIKGDTKKSVPLISEFEVNGNQYLNFNPYPYITIDISNRREKEWNPNQSCILSGLGLYLFTKRLREYCRTLIATKNLFFVHQGRLWLNKDMAMAKEVQKIIPVGKGKACKFSPILIEEENGEQYEGICMMINRPDSYVNLTFEELEYMVNYLENIDFDNLTMNMIQTVLMKDIQKALYHK